jgi:hypothetical protein
LNWGGLGEFPFLLISRSWLIYWSRTSSDGNRRSRFREADSLVCLSGGICDGLNTDWRRTVASFVRAELANLPAELRAPVLTSGLHLVAEFVG